MDSVLEVDEMIIPVTVEYLEEDGIYKVSCPLLQGCHAWGKTLNDCMRAAPENIRAMIECRLVNGSQVPASLEHVRAHTRLAPVRMAPK